MSNDRKKYLINRFCNPKKDFIRSYAKSCAKSS